MKKILIKHADGTTNVIEGENLRFDINNAIVIFEETENEKRLIAHLPLSATCINLDFLASENVTECSNLDKIKFEIKSTSELGIMLDTERPWISVENSLPENANDLELKLKNGVIVHGWYADGHKKWRKITNQRYVDVELDNPVVAWRE